MSYTYYRVNKSNRPPVYYRWDIFNLDVFNNSEEAWVKSMYDNIDEVIRCSGYAKDDISYKEISKDECIKEIMMRVIVS